MTSARLPRTLLATLLALATGAACADGPFGPVNVAANRAQYVGRRCPVKIVFTATVNFEPHERGLAFNYHWERSDGAKGPVRAAHVGRRQRSVVVRDFWTVGGPGARIDAAETIVLNSGFTHERHASPTVRVVCR